MGRSSSTTQHLDRETILRAIVDAGDRKAGAKRLGVHESALRRRIAALEITAEEIDGMLEAERIRLAPTVEESDTETGKSVRVIGYTSLEEALEVSGVDLDVWRVERHKINSWGMVVDGEDCVIHQVTIHLIPRGTDDPEVMAKRLEARLDEIGKRAPHTKFLHPKKRRGLVAEVSLYDFHMGDRVEAEECGEEVTLESSRRRWRVAVDIACERLAGRDVSSIVVPIGHDLAHINGRWGTTGNGTPQDIAASHRRIAEAVDDAVIYAGDSLREIAPVELIAVIGNHGPDLELGACRVARAYYRNDPNVTVDAGPAPLKFRRFGNVTLGFTHGKTEGRRIAAKDLCGQFRQRAGGLADGSVWLELHVGHDHTKEVEEWFGVRYRRVPSLAAPNGWHVHSGYVGSQRCAEVYLWDPVYGEAGKLPVTLREIQDRERGECAA